MSVPGVDHPVVDSAADVTSLGRGLSVDARVEAADLHAVVVRPSVGDFVGQDVVAVGEDVEVFWKGPDGGRALLASVAHVEYGAAPRWHLAVTAPAEDRQRRIAVRCRLSLPVTVTLRGTDLPGRTQDISEAGIRVLIEGFGHQPDPGTVLGVDLGLEDGPERYRAEIVRVHQNRGQDWLMSLRLVDPEERDQDRLRRRVFQALREERAARTAVD
ncbi:PilZ domain-containing protein [Blastococcus sp. URHD0036]|uniref:PilZ domain-containing protein n=1 Tax=Blastococcus sp. URHD0036 TaxID=1380356 RepID=UPI000497EDD7|nr:PilZ domain-containing protein [Blastococcus sp. URHD0036]